MTFYIDLLGRMLAQKTLTDARALAVEWLRSSPLGITISIYSSESKRKMCGYVEHVGPMQYVWYDTVKRKKYLLRPNGTIAPLRW